MSNCGPFRRLLADYKAGDLNPRQNEEINSHLGQCRSCSEVNRELATALDSLRETYHEKYQLDKGIRTRIAAEAAGRVGSAPWLLPFHLRQVSPARYVLAMAAALAIVLSVSVHSRLATRNKDAGEVARVDVVADHGVVRLAWTDGWKETYTVSKSHDPRGQSSHKEYVVRGNVWTDTEPDSSPVVYYRIN